MDKNHLYDLSGKGCRAMPSRQAAAGLLYCMWAPGHLLYELVLVVVFMALAIASAESPEQS